ncbi:MAG: ankyrin repeat domain-containing protein [Candidatus Eremiobacterota bacterium]
MESWIRAAMQAEDFRSALTCVRAFRPTVEGEQAAWAVWKEAQCLHRLGLCTELMDLAVTADPGRYAGRFFSLAADTARQQGDRDRFDLLAARAAEAAEDLHLLHQSLGYCSGPALRRAQLRIGVAHGEAPDAFEGYLALLDMAAKGRDRNLACEAWELTAELRRFCWEADTMQSIVWRWEQAELLHLLAPSQRQAWEEGRMAYQGGASGQVEVLAALEAGGASLEACDVAGRGAAFGAAMTGRVEVLEFLKERRIGLDRPNHQGITPLMVAVLEGHTEVVDFLLPRLARPGHQGPGGNTALHFAVQRRRLEIVEILLRHGANPATANDAGETPRSLARESESEDLRDLLKPPQGGLLGGFLKRKG